jgi:hypothetical protein
MREIFHFLIAVHLKYDVTLSIFRANQKFLSFFLKELFVTIIIKQKESLTYVLESDFVNSHLYPAFWVSDI